MGCAHESAIRGLQTRAKAMAATGVASAVDATGATSHALGVQDRFAASGARRAFAEISTIVRARAGIDADAEPALSSRLAVVAGPAGDEEDLLRGTGCTGARGGIDAEIGHGLLGSGAADEAGNGERSEGAKQAHGLDPRGARRSRTPLM